MALVFAAYAVGAAILARAVWDRPAGPLGLVLLIFGPTGAPFLAQQLGRQDVLILMTAGMAIRASATGRPIVMVASAVAGVLAHDGFLVLVLPTLVVAIGLVSPSPRRDAIWTAAPALAVSLWIHFAHAPDLDTLTRLFVARAVFPPHEDALWLMAGAGPTIAESWERTAAFAGCHLALHTTGTTALLAPVLLAGYSRLRLPWWQSIVTASPLLLLPITTDWGRWLMFWSANVGALVVTTARVRPSRNTPPAHGAVVYGLCLTVLFIGSLNVRSGISIRGWNTLVDHTCVAIRSD